VAGAAGTGGATVELSTVPALTAVPQLVQGADSTMTDESDMTVVPAHPVHPESTATLPHPVSQPVLQAGAGAGAH
jgi:hypothetical protein